MLREGETVDSLSLSQPHLFSITGSKSGDHDFTTTLAEFTAKSGINVTASGTATSFLSRYFMFLITLDNGEQILPVGVRVYIAA